MRMGSQDCVISFVKFPMLIVCEFAFAVLYGKGYFIVRNKEAFENTIKAVLVIVPVVVLAGIAYSATYLRLGFMYLVWFHVMVYSLLYFVCLFLEFKYDENSVEVLASGESTIKLYDFGYEFRYIEIDNINFRRPLLFASLTESFNYVRIIQNKSNLLVVDIPVSRPRTIKACRFPGIKIEILQEHMEKLNSTYIVATGENVRRLKITRDLKRI